MPGSVTPVISEQVYLIAVKYGKGAGSPADMYHRLSTLIAPVPCHASSS